MKAFLFCLIVLVGFAHGYPNLCFGETVTQPLIKKSPSQQREYVISLLKEFTFRHQTFSQEEITSDLLERTKTDIYLLEALTGSTDSAIQERFRTRLALLSKEEILLLEAKRLKSMETCDDLIYYFWKDALKNPEEPFQKSWNNWLDNPVDAFMKSVIMGAYGAIDSVSLLYTVPRWLYTCHEE